MLKKISEEVTFKVDIIEDEPTINVPDEIAITNFKLENNMVSIIDLMIKNNPDLTEEEAREQLEVNKKINEKYLIVENGKAEKTNNEKGKGIQDSY